ncbi:hypothetical protein TKK_0000337 [Trichogramma kaykai]
MQASAETSALDLQTMQSMEWLFKKERIYLLAQFWQQTYWLNECRYETDIGDTFESKSRAISVSINEHRVQ